jgi:methyl-accepting chemotaxis protein
MVSRHARRIALILSTATPLLLGACASQEAVKQAQDTANAAKAEADQALAAAQQAQQAAQQAQQTAQQALQTANQAEGETQALSQKVDKMFQRSLHK